MGNYIKYLFFILLFLSGKPCYSQGSLKKDSLLRKLLVAKNDTAKIRLLHKIGLEYLKYEPDSATWYFMQEGELSNELHDTTGILDYLAGYGTLLTQEDSLEKSLVIDLESVEIAKKATNKKLLFRAYLNIGVSYENLGDYAKGIEYFLLALDHVKQVDNNVTNNFVPYPYANLANLYTHTKQYDKAYQYALIADSISAANKNTRGLIYALTTTGNVLSHLNKNDSALLVLRQAQRSAETINDQYSGEHILLDMGSIYIHTGNYLLLPALYSKAIILAGQLNDKNGMCSALLGMAYYNIFVRRYQAADSLTKESLRIAGENKLNQHIQNAFVVLSDIGLGLHDMKTYQLYLHLSDSMDDVIMSDKMLKNTQELEVKYALEKKQLEIENLKKEKNIEELRVKQHDMLSKLSLLAVVIIAGTGFLYYKNNRQKKRLLLAHQQIQSQQIAQLENEKKLLTTQAVMQGQEEERKRVAKDLHDGLGGILSSAKYSFGNVKDYILFSNENAESFEKGMTMLDMSMQELRRVAHNIMPESLITLGLDASLSDYCNFINQTDTLHIVYQSFDMSDARIEPNKAASIYRIVQELLNNVMKHAHAKNVLVQAIRRNETLSITVEDDGIGFDKAELQNKKGTGYVNLINRVDYLNGSMDIKTSPGKGTCVSLEIPNILS